MMKKAACIFSVAAFLLLTAGETFACVCVRSAPAQDFTEAQAVFSGMVSKAREGRWKIAVERVWKGEVGAEITLRDLFAGSSCAANFKLGKRYIIFASLDGSRRKTTYNPDVCSWTIPFKTYGQQEGDKEIRLMKDYDPTKTVYWAEDWLISILKQLGEEKSPIRSERKR
jgi:hypothetical protein